MTTYKLISADSHVSEPTDLWTTRVEKKHRDQAPRLSRTRATRTARISTRKATRHIRSVSVSARQESPRAGPVPFVTVKPARIGRIRTWTESYFADGFASFPRGVW
jgi:hypothetical protein